MHDSVTDTGCHLDGTSNGSPRESRGRPWADQDQVILYSGHRAEGHSGRNPLSQWMVILIVAMHKAPYVNWSDYHSHQAILGRGDSLDRVYDAMSGLSRAARQETTDTWHSMKLSEHLDFSALLLNSHEASFDQATTPDVCTNVNLIFGYRTIPGNIT